MFFFNETLINSANGYKYLGVWLDPTLNINAHLQRTLKKATAWIKLLSRVRSSLTVSAAIVVYKAFILPIP